MKFIAFVLGLIVSFGAYADDTLATVEVTAVYTGGGGGLVPGYMTRPTHIFSPFLALDEGSYTIEGLSHEDICTALNNNQPDDCSKTSFPATPFLPSSSNVAWTPNGCGSGTISSAFAHIGLSIKYGGGYSGDLDEPATGFDFTHFCNVHDRCYVTSDSKSGCDASFLTNLQGVCGSDSHCNDIADDYYWAVDNYGDDAYDEAQEERECSQWGTAAKEDDC